ncbi:MAG: hypothetical protein AAFY25_07530 [Pseudomonadota bacterium]
MTAEVAIHPDRSIHGLGWAGLGWAIPFMVETGPELPFTGLST